VLVVESHGDFEESLFLQHRVPFPGVYRYVMRYVAEFALRHADLLRAISNSTRQQLQQALPDKWIYQFPTWTDIEVFLQAQGNAVSSSSQQIVYVGVLIPRKGVHFLINAFAQAATDFPQCSLKIIGDEPNKAYAAALKQQVGELELVERVQFVEAMPQAELASVIHDGCVLVLPSVSEGLGRVVVEAMAAGRPVIGSDVGGIPEMVQDGSTGFLLPPGDEIALIERLRWVLEHPGEVHEMGRRAHAFAQHFFSTEVYVQGYRQILDEAQTLLNK
jgi:glycosyltransferase involved in cell wall biosynthesis